MEAAEAATAREAETRRERVGARRAEIDAQVTTRETQRQARERDERRAEEARLCVARHGATGRLPPTRAYALTLVARLTGPGSARFRRRWSARCSGGCRRRSRRVLRGVRSPGIKRILWC